MSNKISPELAARRTAAAAVLADYGDAVASAPLTRPPGREWMFRLADALGLVLDGLADADVTTGSHVAPDSASGPLETAQQARELPAVRAIYDAMHASHRRGVMGERGYRLLDQACQAAGVQVGAYDHEILVWLAGFEPETCAVVAGLITRASQAGGLQ